MAQLIDNYCWQDCVLTTGSLLYRSDNRVPRNTLVQQFAELTRLFEGIRHFVSPKLIAKHLKPNLPICVPLFKVAVVLKAQLRGKLTDKPSELSKCHKTYKIIVCLWICYTV